MKSEVEGRVVSLRRSNEDKAEKIERELTRVLYEGGSSRWSGSGRGGS